MTAQALAPLAEKDLMKLHVRDSSGKEVLARRLILTTTIITNLTCSSSRQTSLRMRQRPLLSLPERNANTQKEDFRAYGRFVRERFDDFAWENDRVGHRTYGKALRTWKGEPLTSSAIDIWSKRTPKLVINDWYMVDNYHVDLGEGVDAYSAGPTRGCGGSGIWSNEQLYIPTNFVDSRVLTNGPIRVMFELVYEPFDVNGTKVSEVLRVSLDAGSQLNHFQASYQASVVARRCCRTKESQRRTEAVQRRARLVNDLGTDGQEPRDAGLGDCRKSRMTSTSSLKIS